MYLNIFKHHWHAVARWCHANDAHPQLDPFSWKLEIRQGPRTGVFQPRFVSKQSGVLAYSDAPGAQNTFVGWVEPMTTRIPLARDKVAFKQAALALNLRVPAAWNHGEPVCSHVLVKHRTGSFGRNISGPWDVKHGAPDLPDAQSYFEQFIPGLPLKAWVFEGRMVALERVEQPFLLGDGQRSLRELAKPRGSMDQALPLEQAQDYLRWQGWSLDSVLPLGRKAWLSYLYRSPFHTYSGTDPDCLALLSTGVREQLDTGASRLWQSLPAADQPRRLFTLDAVMDQDDRIWFLEVNSHPMIHPNIYAELFDAVFKDA